MLLGQSENERNHELRLRPKEHHPCGGAWIEILCKAFDSEWQTGAAKQNGKQIASNRPGRSCRIFGLSRGPPVTAFKRDAFSARKAPSERMVIMNMTAPLARPARPYFSSGPCAKRPGSQIQNLQDAPLGRSHRAKAAKTRLKLGVGLTREILQVPADYRIGIVPASDTGAVEMALWSLLGPRGVDALAWESFGEGWVTDIVKQLKLKDARVLKAPYGEIVDLASVNFDNDVIFTWNGTTSGVRVPNGDWIPADRKGLTIADATSAAFAQKLDWAKLDVVTFSWQKALGGEAAHGVLILSPRAVERLESHSPAWPMPKIFRMTKGGKLIEGVFEGETINT